MEGRIRLTDFFARLCCGVAGFFGPLWSRLVSWLDPILGRVATGWSRIWNPLVRAPWLCGYATFAALLVAYLFIANDQGQDLLRISAERGFAPWNLLFFVGAAVLALTLWYTSRLLLGRRFENFPLDLSHARWLQRWMPRAFGIVVPLSIAVGLARIRSDDTQLAVWILCGLYVLLTLWVAWFFHARRRLFKIADEALMETRVDALGQCDRVLVWGGGILSFLLLGAFMIWPVGLPQFIGAPAIVVLGLAGIALFGSMVLTYAFLAYGQPAGTALALVLAVVFAFWNDNHWVRTVDEAAFAAAEAAADARPSPGGHYSNWRAAHGEFTPIGGREPVILVAASGGGIRAAYWTASTLAAMDSIAGFDDNLFAISGVSGGSVGAATYVALKRRALETGAPKDLLPLVRETLGQDFLSPVVAGLLFPDLAQRFLPFPIASADRQRFLEKSWEGALGSTPNAFTDSFTALYDLVYGDRLPSLLLNATVVDSGRRAIVANMKIDAFTDSVDLLADGYSTRGARLSASAGMSARFTYVSPPGSLTRPYDDKGKVDEVKMRVVDGGYFENSGAATLMDLLNVLVQKERNLFPILILIRNDPKAPSVCHRSGEETPGIFDEGPAGPPSGDFLAEVAAPVRALLNARSARGRLAEVDAAHEVEGRRLLQSRVESEAAKTVQDLGGAVIEISLAAVAQANLDEARAKGAEEEEKQKLRERVVEPPLGWSLSGEVREEMDRVLDERGGGLQRELDILQALLRGELDPSRDRCDAR